MLLVGYCAFTAGYYGISGGWWDVAAVGVLYHIPVGITRFLLQYFPLYVVW